MGDGFFQLWFAVRYVHVASAALLAGGALVMCALCAAPSSADQPSAALAAATLYEWGFWVIAGVTAATGVSNLGLKGDGLLGADTSWGVALSIKLTLVLCLLALAVVRTDFVVRCSAAARTSTRRCHLVLTSLYGATVAAFLGALWIGLGLAHGRY